MSFTWIFAIIVGAVILFISIYMAVKLLGVGEDVNSVETSKSILNSVESLESSVESGRSTFITISADTRIYEYCSDTGTFGKQRIDISQKNFNKWSEKEKGVSSENRYLFFGSPTEGKKFFMFMKPIELPFKIADVVYITSANKKYCFIDAPDDIQYALAQPFQENILVSDCEDIKGITKVCFNSEDCDINVDYTNKYVEKNGESSKFLTDTLMYAAIFSDKTIYECQLNRLMKRAQMIAELYQQKIIFARCGESMGADLSALISFYSNFASSDELASLEDIANEAQSNNEDNSECKLWSSNYEN